MTDKIKQALETGRNDAEAFGNEVKLKLYDEALAEHEKAKDE